MGLFELIGQWGGSAFFWAFVVAAVILGFESSKPYYRSGKWYFIVLSVLLCLVAIFPHGWDMAFSPEQEFGGSIDAVLGFKQPEQPNFKAHFIADIIGTALGGLAGFVAVVWFKKQSRGY